MANIKEVKRNNKRNKKFLITFQSCKEEVTTELGFCLDIHDDEDDD